MLEHSFKEDGFGEFPPTALYAPEVFTTVNHLKLLVKGSENASKNGKTSEIHEFLRFFFRKISRINRKRLKTSKKSPKNAQFWLFLHSVYKRRRVVLVDKTEGEIWNLSDFWSILEVF